MLKKLICLFLALASLGTLAFAETTEDPEARIAELEKLRPGFVSVTWGAGGSTRSQTVELVTRIEREIGITAMAHLTCVGASAEDLAGILDRLADVPALTLLLVGDGADLPAVRREVEARGLADRVRLPGRVPHHAIPEWIACMDYAFLPDSNEYGSPMKLFELMAMGVAVVAPDYDPVAEVIADGATGWLFPRKRLDACVDRVLALADNPGERGRVGTAARAYIERERRWRNNAEQLLSLLPGHR